MANVLGCSLEVNKFELQSYYYVLFRTNTLKKGIEPIYSLSYVLNSIIAVLL